MKVCDEIILMNQGEILLNGPPETVQNDRLAQNFIWRNKLKIYKVK